MTVFTPSSEDTRIYEYCILIPFPLSQKEEQDLVKEIESVFDSVDGKQLNKDVWGRRGLAYTIEGYDEGNFIIYHYELDPSKIAEIEQSLRIMKGVLRYLVVKPPKNYEVVNYSAEFENWKKNEQEREQAKKQRREEELKQKMLRKQKSAGKRSKKDDAPREKGEEKEIGSEIDKLIADDELEL